MKLTVALKMTRQDLARTQMELNTMKANFGDVVPRRDFEMQEKTNKDLQEQVLVGRQVRQGRTRSFRRAARTNHLAHSWTASEMTTKRSARSTRSCCSCI